MMNIGQAARHSGLSPKMIRYYESIGLLPENKRSANGYRLFGKAELRALAFIKRARDLGFSLEEVSKLLTLWQNRNRASADVKLLADEHIAALERRIAELTELRDTLKELTTTCHGDDQPDCPILSVLEKPCCSAHQD